MNLLDLFILIPVVWGCIRGFSKGLIIELATLAGLLLGILAAFYFSPDVSDFLGNYFTLNPKTLKVISYILIFLAVMLLAYLLGKILEKVIDMIALGWLNKLLGAIVGLAKGVLVSALILFLVTMADKNERLLTRETKEKSMFYQSLAKVIPSLIPKSRGEEDVYSL